MEENFKACSKCVNKLLNTWLSVWSLFASILPNYKLKDENRRASAQVYDVCNLHYDDKLKVAYRLCCVVEFLPSYDGLVREVKFSFRPRRHTGAGTFLPVELNTPLLSGKKRRREEGVVLFSFKMAVKQEKARAHILKAERKVCHTT